ncbi:phosphoribosylanthranilate isomerase [Polycladidibacter stylochi]|uniref:phosphoribosylanthranilate isomerase n=1 Tax=Polycladidibacter stylochi TaxID=1807766 RepID=UPI00082BC944|nr:phosphoribosylanthranilate isomerase [Pseudovibrio stylochi]
MSQLKIKICGLTTTDIIDSALAANVDMIGLVFFPKSPRNVSYEQARKLADYMKGRTKIVALTVNMPLDEMEKLVRTVQPDILQLHGHESPEQCLKVKQAFQLPIMKAFGISTREDLEKANNYSAVVDRFLFDAKPPKGVDVPGGNGVSFDWRLLQNTPITKPYMLSGGLDCDNVAQAIKLSGAREIDVSSGVESSRGVKDPELISAFVRNARSAL